MTFPIRWLLSIYFCSLVLGTVYYANKIYVVLPLLPPLLLPIHTAIYQLICLNVKCICNFRLPRISRRNFARRAIKTIVNIRTRTVITIILLLSYPIQSLLWRYLTRVRAHTLSDVYTIIIFCLGVIHPYLDFLTPRKNLKFKPGIKFEFFFLGKIKLTDEPQ